MVGHILLWCTLFTPAHATTKFVPKLRLANLGRRKLMRIFVSLFSGSSCVYFRDRPGHHQQGFAKIDDIVVVVVVAFRSLIKQHKFLTSGP